MHSEVICLSVAVSIGAQFQGWKCWAGGHVREASRAAYWGRVVNVSGLKQLPRIAGIGRLIGIYRSSDPATALLALQSAPISTCLRAHSNVRLPDSYHRRPGLPHS